MNTCMISDYKKHTKWRVVSVYIEPAPLVILPSSLPHQVDSKPVAFDWRYSPHCCVVCNVAAILSRFPFCLGTAEREIERKEKQTFLWLHGAVLQLANVPQMWHYLLAGIALVLRRVTHFANKLVWRPWTYEYIDLVGRLREWATRYQSWRERGELHETGVSVRA